MKKIKLQTAFLLFTFIILTACTATEPASESTQNETESVNIEPVSTQNPDARTQPSTQSESDQVRLPDLDGREITVAVTHDYLPFNYVLLENGEPAGWDYDAINAICALLNCTPKFVQLDWEIMIEAVGNGEVDMAAEGITITTERKEIVAFSKGYIDIKQRMLVDASEERFTDFRTFLTNRELVVGALSDTTNYDAAVALVGEERTVGFDTIPESVQALTDGEIDVILIDDTAGSGYTGFKANQVKFIGEPLTTDELGFIFPKRSDLVSPINLALDQLNEDGTLESLAQKYFTDSFQLTYDDIADPSTLEN